MSMNSLDRLPVAAWACGPDGRISWYNAEAALLWGGSPALDTDAPKYCGALRCFDREGVPVPPEQMLAALVIRDGCDYRNREELIERADGTRSQVLVQAGPLFDENGAVVGALTVA